MNLINPKYKEVFDVIMYYAIPPLKLVGAFALVRLIKDLSWLAHMFRGAAESINMRDGGKDDGSI